MACLRFNYGEGSESGPMYMLYVLYTVYIHIILFYIIE